MRRLCQELPCWRYLCRCRGWLCLRYDQRMVAGSKIGGLTEEAAAPPDKQSLYLKVFSLALGVVCPSLDILLKSRFVAPSHGKTPSLLSTFLTPLFSVQFAAVSVQPPTWPCLPYCGMIFVWLNNPNFCVLRCLPHGARFH